MVAAPDGLAPMSFRRPRVWALVLVAHLLLAWWLLTLTGHSAGPAPRASRDAVLIQQVAVAPPESPALPGANRRPAPAPAPAPASLPERPDVEAVAPAAPVAPPHPAEPVPVAKPPPATPRAAVAPNRAPAPADPLPAPAALPTPASPAQAPVAAGQASPSPAASTTAADGPAAAGTPSVPGTAASPGAAPSAATPGATAGGSTRVAPSAGPTSAPPPRASPETDVTVACPVQIAPVTPQMAIRGGISGEVVAQALIVGGKVTEVRILSGPPVFHNAVRTAMQQYRCVSGVSEARVTQHFRFRLQ